MDMAQNINRQYVFMQNAGVLASGHRDQLPPSSLQGAISMHRTNPGGRANSDHKLWMGFTQVPAQKKMDTEWRNCGKDQMIARSFAPAGRTAKDFPDADFLPICTGMRTLCPACDLIVSPVAANDMHDLEEIEEAVVELVKDSCRKLKDTNNKGKMGVANPAIPPGQVVVHASLLPPGAPNQWGAATTIGNPGQLPPNRPPAHIPAGGQLGQAPPGAAGAKVQAAQVNVTAAGQLGQAPPGAAGPNVLAAQVNVPAAGQLRQAPAGDVPAAGPDVPVQPGNDPAHPQMVCDSSSVDNDPAPAQMLPDPPDNGPAAVQNQPLAWGFRPAPNRSPTG